MVGTRFLAICVATGRPVTIEIWRENHRGLPYFWLRDESHALHVYSSLAAVKKEYTIRLRIRENKSGEY